MLKILSTSPDYTLELGSQLGGILLPGDFLNLNGDLGAGKTFLVKAIGVGLGLAFAEVTSPTFTIINEYEGIYPLYHFDFYRLDSELALEQTGYADYFFGSGITVVEWGNLFRDYLPKERLDITLQSEGPEQRLLTLEALGQRGAKLLESLRGLL